MALLVKQWLLLSLGIFLAHARPKGLFNFPLFCSFCFDCIQRNQLDMTLTMYTFVN